MDARRPALVDRKKKPGVIAELVAFAWKRPLSLFKEINDAAVWNLTCDPGNL